MVSSWELLADWQATEDDPRITTDNGQVIPVLWHPAVVVRELADEAVLDMASVPVTRPPLREARRRALAGRLRPQLARSFARRRCSFETTSSLA